MGSVRRGWQAACTNARPGLVILAVALGIVLDQLPLALQLPLQNLILCLFVLLVMILTGDPRGARYADRSP